VTAPLTRRTLIGTSLLAVGLSACDDVPLEQTRPGALTQPSASPAAGPDPDEDLLRAALVLEATQVARLDRVGRLRVPADVRGLVSAARTVHQAHVDLLRGDDPAPQVQPPTSLPRRLLGRLGGTELGIAEQHAAAALAAQSGPFARVLASMAAAARQQATLLGPLGDQLGGPS
jgi:hypothetical protein